HRRHRPRHLHPRGRNTARIGGQDRGCLRQRSPPSAAWGEGRKMKPPSDPAETDLTETVLVEPDVTVDILIESEAWQMLPDAEDIARRAIVFAAVSNAQMCPRNAELSVLLCDDATIAALNGRWRGQERPTNVLSFPALSLQGAATGEKAPKQAPKQAPL